MSQTRRPDESNPMLSRLQFEFAENPTVDLNTFAENLNRGVSEVATVEYIERDQNVISCVVEARPTEFDSEELESVVMTEIGLEPSEIWVRRVFQDELKAVKEGTEELE